MKLSARNVLQGTVVDVTKGQTTAHASAIIKASDVIIGK